MMQASKKCHPEEAGEFLLTYSKISQKDQIRASLRDGSVAHTQMSVWCKAALFLLIQSFCSKRKFGWEHFWDHSAEAELMALELCDKLEKIRVRILLQLACSLKKSCHKPSTCIFFNRQMAIDYNIPYQCIGHVLFPSCCKMYTPAFRKGFVERPY